MATLQRGTDPLVSRRSFLPASAALLVSIVSARWPSYDTAAFLPARDVARLRSDLSRTTAAPEGTKPHTNRKQRMTIKTDA